MRYFGPKSVGRPSFAVTLFVIFTVFVPYKCTNDESEGINELLGPENIRFDTKINFL